MNYLGLDVHSATFTLAHLNHRGRLCRVWDRPTSAKELIDVVGAVKGARQLVVEECHLAQWVKSVLEPHVDQLVICDPKRNHWIAKDEYATDRSSAVKLATLLRGGFIKEIVHPDAEHAEIRSLFVLYHNLNGHVTRYKNKLKAAFRQVAVRTDGRGVYATQHRDWWLGQLAEFPSLQLRARIYYDFVDLSEDRKQRVFMRLRRMVQANPAFEILMTAPGIGPVLSAGYIALIETPRRFSRKNKLWAYASLSVRSHESDGTTYTNRSSNTGCRPLKWVVMQQFHNAINVAKASNQFKEQYQRLIQAGTSWRAARRSVCRSMLSTVRSMWVKGEPFREMSDAPAQR